MSSVFRIVTVLIITFLLRIISSKPTAVISSNVFSEKIIFNSCNVNDLRNLSDYEINPKEIIINHCNLPELPNAIFLRLRDLRVLEITDSKLTYITDYALNGLQNLETLSLIKNNLSEIRSWSDEDLISLHFLDLRRNHFKYLNQKNFKRFPNLQKLNLAVNVISDIPDGIFKCISHLKYLNIGKNLLREIHSYTFKGLIKLNHLALHNNQIEFIDKNALSTNTNLKSLRLEGNRLAYLDPVLLMDMPRLAHLNISHNQLDTFHEGSLNKNFELKSLDMSFNKFSILEDFVFIGLQSLEVLNVSNNYIDIIDPTGFQDLNNMKHFDLSANNLTYLSPEIFEYFPQVEYINLSRNELHEIDSVMFKELGVLRELDLSFNRLHKDNFLNLQPKVEYLDLRNNMYRTLNLSMLYGLTEVDLMGNPWNCKWLITEMLRAPSSIRFGTNYIIESREHILTVPGIDCYDEVTRRSIIMIESQGTNGIEEIVQTSTHHPFRRGQFSISIDEFDHRSVLLWIFIAVSVVFGIVRLGKSLMNRSEKQSESFRRDQEEKMLKEVDGYFDVQENKNLT